MAAARKGVGLPFAVFAGAVGMSAYVWSQQSPEQAHRIVEDVKYTVHKAESEAIHVAHVVEEEAKQAYHKIEDETRQVYDKVSHSDQVKQISSATADALAKGKAVTDDLVKQAHEASSDAAHQVKVMSGHLLEDAKHSLDKAPGILDQLKQKTENLLQSGHKEAFSDAAIEGKAREVAQAAGSKSGSVGSGSAPAAKSGPADNSWAAPAAFLVGHLGFISWHKSGGSSA